MAKTREDYQPDVGGFLDGKEGAITDAVFEVASGEYADRVMLGGSDSKPPVVVTLTVDCPELDKPANQSYSVGGQDIWDIVNDGKAIVNKKNPDKHVFRDGSIAMHLVEAMAIAIGEGSIEKGQETFIKRDHYMTTADFYTGFNFLWETTEIKRKIGEKDIISRPPLPAKYLGEVSATAGTSKPATSATVEDAALDQILIDNASGKVERELKSFAVRNDEIKKNDLYMKAVVNGAKITELEKAGKLTRNPEDGKFL